MKARQERELNKGLNVLAKTSVIVFIGVFLSKLLSYAYRIIIARHYGPEVYGLFALALMVSSWFIIFSELGLGEGLVKFIPYFRGKKENEKIKHIFRRSLFVMGLLSLAGGLLLFVLSDFISLSIFNEPGLSIFLKVFALVIPLTVLSNLFLTLLRSFEKITEYTFVFNVFGNLAKVVAIGLFVWAGVGSIGVANSYVIGMFLTLIAGLIICLLSFPVIFQGRDKNLKIERGEFRKVFHYSWPLLFFGLMASVMHWTDSFVIGVFENAQSVGIYNAAVPIAVLLGMASQLFLELFFPLINREHGKNNSEVIKQLSQQVGKWVFMINLPLFVLIFLFPGAFINILFGTEYLSGEMALRFLAVGYLFSSVFNISGSLLKMLGKSKLILADISVSVILNIVLNVILVPMYGITGAAVATMTSMVFLNLLFAIQVKKSLGILPIRRKMFGILIIGLVLGTGLYFARSMLGSVSLVTLVMVAIGYYIVYILAMVLGKMFDKNDLSVLKSVWKKIVG